MPSVWSGTLTSHIWAWSVVCTVLQQPVLLLWFRIGVPRVLGALRWAILHRVVVELKALALWSHLSLVSTSTVGCCGDEREAWIKPNSVLGKCPSLWNGGNHPQCTKSESLPDMSKAFIFNTTLEPFHVWLGTLRVPDPPHFHLFEELVTLTHCAAAIYIF